MGKGLKGLRIALAEGRQLEELAALLEKEGAVPIRCPLVNILDAPDSAAIQEWLLDLTRDRFALVVLMTGEGLRRLMGFAERAGLREQALAALRKTRTLTRGPKPANALKELGMVPSLIARAPTTQGVIEILKELDLAGSIVGVQLHEGADPALVSFIDEAHATARVVIPYVYAPASDENRVEQLIEQAAQGGVDAIVFTSSPQVDRLFDVTRERGVEALRQQALQRVRIAAVGPIVAGNLRQRGVRVDICPEQGFVMKNLVQQMKKYFDAP